MAAIRQAGFGAGEWAPSLYGRNDLDHYPQATRTLRNMYVTPHGAAVNRPGTLYCGAVKDSTKKVRLVPFVYSETETYVLEFGHNYIRFWQSGALVASGGAPYELGCSYTEDQLPYLKFAQVGAVLTICHPAHPPTELKRNRAPQPDWGLASGLFGGVPIAATGSGTAFVNQAIVAEDAQHPAREWVWQVTGLLEAEADGATYETTPYTLGLYSTDGGATFAALPAKHVVYADKAVSLKWTMTPAATGYRQVAWRVYRGRGQAFGYIGETTTREFVDVGTAPDFNMQPPTGLNPFDVRNTAGTIVRTENPAVVAHHQQRRVFANAGYNGDTYRPGTIWGSFVGDYTRYAPQLPAAEDTPYQFDLASLTREEIRSVVPLDRLIVLTDTHAWSVGGSSGAVLAPTDVDTQVHASLGANWLDPLQLGDSLLYVPARGNGVQQLAYAKERERFVGQDAAWYAQHLFYNRTVAAWAYQHTPHRVVWLAMGSDGMLSLSWSPETGVAAWARHDTQGAVESVCCIPEAGKDRVYLVVARAIGGTTHRYLERLAERDLDSVDATNAVFLDCAKTRTGSTTAAITGLSHLNGETVYALADATVQGPFTVASGAITLEEAASVVTVGLAYVSDLEAMDVAVQGQDIRGRQKQVTEALVEVVVSRGLWVGEDEATLKEVRPRDVASGYGPLGLATTRLRVAINARWNEGGRVYLRQVDPLPLAVVGLTRDVALGG